MDINSFIEKFTEQFDDLGGAEVGSETKFRDLPSWSSIVALSVKAMIEDEYGVEIEFSDIRSSQTVKDIFDKVVAKVG